MSSSVKPLEMVAYTLATFNDGRISCLQILKKLGCLVEKLSEMYCEKKGLHRIRESAEIAKLYGKEARVEGKQKEKELEEYKTESREEYMTTLLQQNATFITLVILMLLH